MANLVSRLCYRFKLKTVSPLSIGGNYTELTDHDIIRYFDANSTPFIPASTIGGCFFTKDDEFKKVFGIYDLGLQENASLAESSSIFISDGLFLNNPKISYRDNNALEKSQELYKQTKEGAKFDNEIIQNNQEWSFFITLTLTDRNHDESYYDAIIKTIAGRIQSGLYRIGYKQNRGYGKQTIIEIYKKVYDRTNYKEYLTFDGYSFTGEKINFVEDTLKDYITLSMPIKAITPICIKDYSATKHMPDYAQIKGVGENHKEVAAIPGTSLNGTIQSAVSNICNQLLLSNLILDEDFKKYVIDELYLEGKFLVQQRNRIDRFSAGTIDGALYTEEIFTPDERSTGTIKIRFKHHNLKLIACFYLALEDIAEGYISIGGNEAIGRGIFEKTGNIVITGTTKEELSKALKEDK